MDDSVQMAGEALAAGNGAVALTKVLARLAWICVNSAVCAATCSANRAVCQL